MKTVVPRRALQILCIATMAAAGACQDPTQLPDYNIVPQLQINKRWADPGSPIELTYRFEVAADNGAIEDDYEVSVDFVGAETIFSDHHMPPTPTSAWMPGSVIQYSRTIFVPPGANPGSATVELSLRVPKIGRLVALAGGENGSGLLVSQVGQLTVNPRVTGLPISYENGWYGLETAVDDPAIQWQWTAGSALSSFPNPRTGVVIYLHAYANVEAAGEPAEVRVRVGSPGALLEVARFRVEQPGAFLERIYVPAKLMGGMDAVELLIRTDKVLVPSEVESSSDSRSLGLRVFNLYDG